MQISLNGNPYNFTQAMSVQDLVEELKLNLSQVAIERNREIVLRSLYDKTMLQNGDDIEIVTFIGGG